MIHFDTKKGSDAWRSRISFLDGERVVAEKVVVAQEAIGTVGSREMC